jgi:Helix-turn-helix domain
MPRGGQVKTVLRKKIRELFRSGETLVSIAKKLGKAPSTIAYHVRALGVPPIKHFRALPLTNGKRRCAACRRWKAPNLFPSGANPVCTKCYVTGKTPAAIDGHEKANKHK